MNEKALKTLEYNKIIEKLSSFAGSGLGKALCNSLLPVSDIEEIKKAQRETSDALSRILRKGSLGFYGVHDIRASLKRLEVDSSLSAQELLHLSSVLDATARIRAYGLKDSGDSDSTLKETDSLEEMFRSLEPLTLLNNEIKRCIISEEEIADDASPALKSIRRSLKLTNDKIHDQLNSIVNSSGSKTMLQENIVTMRNGRYCIPIKQEYRSQFPGMIHDQSSSGSTIFVEPMAVVKLNNDLRELEIKEQQEIERILEALSEQAGQHSEKLYNNIKVLPELDFIFAKATLSKQMKGIEPLFNDKGIVNIKKGRHPLIDAKKVVPIDITLGKDFNLLVITGPNTGGKTVSLKTVGLFTLLGQSGLHIPAFDGSELAVFEEVYADIGDEQSIEQSLSTFSSHMTNTVSILEKANYQSLVLFDELGAGTDPTEGAALAMAILNYLHKRHVRTMATTHYSELKVYALTTEGVSNASCEFDVETLRPTYRLLIGIPGKSNAFAISSKLGLPSHIIEDAQNLIGVQEKSFEDVISDLEKNRLEIEREKEEIAALREQAKNLQVKLEQQNDKLASAKDRIMAEANEEARKVLQEAKDVADRTIKNFNKWGSEGGFGKEMEHERGKVRDLLSSTEGKLAIKGKQKSSKTPKPGEFKIGDAVHVNSLGLKGTVSTLPNAKGDLYVQMGILRSQVNISDLELIDEPDITGPNITKSGSGKIKISKALHISPEVNLIGKTVDEALSELDKYLDDAYLSHLPQVTVIHGRGTGALRNAVHSHLKKTKYVKSYREGAFGEGGQGVTIVEFKQ
ncbi:DNA mismatch repair protein MutS2 [Anaerocolumna jejuensis DSM 15929]|uniref:Endonuclease MutS2 n=1 Tax=Anaerocolumna jejuensis DSM 15929 TaxID=1121322 RepID=A0A1M7BQF8_9FIRM|nr:endonuclease MutS2 [Anaerocolumna jejuensis]SHL57288.1 DNA mismatch repair protein MutS2 [Anaerocolumna jejuensis DSM 15929]